MPSNFCEDQQVIDKVGAFHEKILSTFGIPKWAHVNCPFCKRELPLRSVRSISVLLNTRNLGDVAVEVFCIHCSKLDTLYFKSEVENIGDFVKLLGSDSPLKSTPALEDDMYKMGYNNVVEKMVVSGEYS